MNHFFAAIGSLIAFTMLAAPPVRAAEATFDRDLAFTGRLDLSVATGSGSIHLTRGSDGHIHIFGRVRSGWGGNDDRVREIAAHPPVEQTANIVRIGSRHENMNNISIDYEIQAPANAFLNAATGSGNITDEGVGANAHISTGSGSVRATGLQGGFSLETGSGGIYAEQVGTGDVKAGTGSGSIELRNLNGGLHAETGSGGIKAAGTPAGPWRIGTGSGSVEIWTGNAGFMLESGTGSGSIHSDREVLTQGASAHHHLKGKVGSGGPVVRITTGSGNIRIH